MSDPSLLRHVVLFQFKDGTPDEKIREIENAFRACLRRSAPSTTLNGGTDISVEGKADDFTHCFFVTFANEADRDAYLPHPDHAAFGTLLRPHLQKVLVVDYWQRT